eukprot:6185070-Pleurochrysis_carterae.AAC.2
MIVLKTDCAPSVHLGMSSELSIFERLLHSEGALTRQFRVERKPDTFTSTETSLSDRSTSSLYA